MKLGIDCFDKYAKLFEGKRVGLITNPTGINSDFVSTIDVLKEKTNLVALYSPEHGVRANIQAGEKMESYVDSQTGVMVHSLYGKTKRPTKELLDEIDIMCIDIQDVGSRFYTFIYTMVYAMEACSEYGMDFVVFDRPNPANANDVEGNLLDINYRSFIGYFPITQRHGLTIGEVALLFKGEHCPDCKLHVIPMEGYDRHMYYEDTKCLWVLPSPNFPTPNTALVYNCTCIFEGTNISEGRGTTIPFEVVGAPFIDPYKLADVLNGYNFKGVYFRPMFYTPTFAKFVGEMCGGVQVHVFDRDLFTPVKVGWTMLQVIRDMYPNDYKTNKPYKEGCHCMLELNTGCDYIIANKYSIEEQMEIIDRDTLKFKKIREKYLIY